MGGTLTWRGLTPGTRWFLADGWVAVGSEGALDVFHDAREVAPAPPCFDAQYVPSDRSEDPVADDVFSDLLAPVVDVMVAVHLDVEPPVRPPEGEVELEALDEDLQLWGETRYA